MHEVFANGNCLRFGYIAFSSCKNEEFLVETLMKVEISIVSRSLCGNVDMSISSSYFFLQFRDAFVSIMRKTIGMTLPKRLIK